MTLHISIIPILQIQKQRYREVMDVWLYTQELRKEGLEATKSGPRAVFFTATWDAVGAFHIGMLAWRKALEGVG